MREAYDLSTQATGPEAALSMEQVQGRQTRATEKRNWDGGEKKGEQGREWVFQAQISGIDLADLSIRFSLHRLSLKQWFSTSLMLQPVGRVPAAIPKQPQRGLLLITNARQIA